jgi:hypothetical protein
MHKWGIDRILFPNIVRQASKLIVYAAQQVEQRMQADPNRKDFFWYIANGKDKNGDLAYKDQREIFAEARALIIGGMFWRDELEPRYLYHFFC